MNTIDKKDLCILQDILEGMPKKDLMKKYKITMPQIMSRSNRAAEDIYTNYKGLVNECCCWHCWNGKIMHNQHKTSYCEASPIIWLHAIAIYNSLERLYNESKSSICNKENM